MTISETDAAANRRWLIGLSITLVFGIFGAVMALLRYADQGKTQPSPAATSVVAPAAADPPVRPSQGKRNGHK
jgi:hypothetical protein